MRIVDPDLRQASPPARTRRGGPPRLLRLSTVMMPILLVAARAVALDPGAREVIRRHDIADSVTLALASDQGFAAVGYLTVDGARIGSAVLVGERSVLTAAHVLKQVTGGHEIQFVVEPEPGDRVQRKVTNVVVHDHATWPLTEGRIDLAILTLDRRPGSVAPAVLNGGYTEIGSPGVIVGYGVSQSAFGSTSADISPRRRAGENMIDLYGQGADGLGLPALLASDLDHPSDPSLNVLGDPEPLTVESIPTGGDSGGALFIRRESGWMLVGISSTVRVETSAVNGLYGSLAFWVRVADHLAWIRDHVPDLVTSIPDR